MPLRPRMTIQAKVRTTTLVTIGSTMTNTSSDLPAAASARVHSHASG